METLIFSDVRPITEAIVYDTFIELNLVLRYYRYNDNYFIKLHVPLPDNYPDTELSSNYLVNQVGLFEAELSMIGPHSSWNPYFHKIQRILQRSAKYGLVLHGFYMIPKRDQVPITIEERNFLKGLGKKALCLGIDHIITSLELAPHQTVLLLEASGGKIESEADQRAVQNYMSWSYEDLLDRYKKQYYADYLLYEPNDEDQKEFLAETLVRNHNNKRLIDYYKSAFGFISLDRLVEDRHMGVFIDTFLDHC
jgi:hypothetical protein